MEQGYAVTLVTLNTLGDPCMMEQAHRSAQHLGLPLRMEDLRVAFRRDIIDYFTESYMRGETPAPCTRCNTLIKWKTLYDIARREGYDHIATGHYFRILHEDDIYYVRTAVDPIKDQSYYLWDLPQEYLQTALTPMGDRVKSEVTATLPSTQRPRESMSICFVKDRSYTEFLKREVPGIIPGDIVTSQGEIVGRHDGCALYTIGQKRGVRTNHPAAIQVTDIDAKHNRIIAGNDTDLYHHHLELKSYRIPNLPQLLSSDTVRVKIRGVGRNPEGFARIRPQGELLHIDLEQPAWAAAKGQPVVLYDHDRVVGGGILAHYV